MNVGIIGLGGLGRAMCARLLAAGHTVAAYDINPAAVDAVARNGAKAGSSPAAVAACSELVISVIWDDVALEAVVFGDEGLLSGPFSGCFVDLSTTSVDVACRVGLVFDDRGAVFLDGAVIGGGVPAANAGESPIVIAGDEAAYERYRHVLECLGRVDHVGAQGSAKVVKVINNHLVAIVSAANAEALSLGLSDGVSVDVMFDVIRDSAATSTVFESYIGRYLAEGRYGEGLIGHDLMHKDITLACRLADALDCPAPMAGIAQQIYVACGQILGGHAPFPTSFDYFRHLADVRPGLTSNATQN